MTTHEPDYRFTRPGALIAALPAVLGFVPEKSLVLVSLEDREMGAVMRVDLSKAMDGDLTHLADVAAASGADTVVAVIVDADGAACPMCNQDYRDMCDELNAALSAHDMTVYATHVVDRIEAGGRWHCVDGCGAFGAVEDPMASPLAAAAVLEGDGCIHAGPICRRWWRLPMPAALRRWCRRSPLTRRRARPTGAPIRTGAVVAMSRRPWPSPPG